MSRFLCLQLAGLVMGIASAIALPPSPGARLGAAPLPVAPLPVAPKLACATVENDGKSVVVEYADGYKCRFHSL